MTSSTFTPLITSSKLVHRRLTRDLTLLVLLLIFVFLLLSYFYSRQIQKDISLAIIDSAQKMVIQKNNQIFEPISNNLNLSRKWAELESLTTDKHNIFNKRFIPILETMPHISSVIIASSDGKEYFLTKKDNNWLSRHIDSSKYGQEVAKWQVWNSNNQLIKEWQDKTQYTPAQRPWYQLGMSAQSDKTIMWTAPYSFYTQQEPGITGVTRWQHGNNTQFILAFDVTLSDIAQTLAKVTINPDDIAYLISPKGEVILPPGNQPVVRGSLESGSLYAPSSDNKNHLIFDSVTHWKRNKSPLDTTGQFSRNGQRWWYKVFVLESYNNSIYAGVIAPEKKLLDIFNENIRIIIGGIIILFILAVVMANILVKKYAHQLKDLPKTTISKSDFTNEIYTLLRQGESETLEFKSTMRKNLKSGKNGKEIEIAWLKGLVGFMNTNGGILLIGVDDESNILGIDADEFENEDKILLHFKNLISQHIGLEFSKYINLTIKTIEDKTILVVECERADRPVFLHHKNDESFYIRSGPASVNLSISKVIRYIQNRY